MVVILLDLFTNISTYITHEVSYINIMKLTLLYLPKAISYAIAPSMLFAVTYTLSSMHARNELISILNSGISYYALISILIIFGLAVSVGNFLFQEHLVIDSYAEKQELTQEVTGFSTSYNNSNVVLLSEDQRDVYYARYYNDRRQELSSLVLIFRDEQGRMDRRIDIDTAVFDDELSQWTGTGVSEYRVVDREIAAIEGERMFLSSELFEPEDFRKITYDINEMNIKEAKYYMERMQRLDMQRFRELAADYYERFAFSLTPLIVVLISCSIGTRFKKNILLYSLLLCIIISLLYYVSEMLTMLLAKQGFLPPAAGGWIPVIGFAAAGFIALFKVRT
jgi:lipopolysaccharide export system permease protein